MHIENSTNIILLHIWFPPSWRTSDKLLIPDINCTIMLLSFYRLWSHLPAPWVGKGLQWGQEAICCRHHQRSNKVQKEEACSNIGGVENQPKGGPCQGSAQSGCRGRDELSRWTEKETTLYLKEMTTHMETITVVKLYRSLSQLEHTSIMSACMCIGMYRNTDYYNQR